MKTAEDSEDAEDYRLLCIDALLFEERRSMKI